MISPELWVGITSTVVGGLILGMLTGAGRTTRSVIHSWRKRRQSSRPNSTAPARLTGATLPPPGNGPVIARLAGALLQLATDESRAMIEFWGEQHEQAKQLVEVFERAGWATTANHLALEVQKPAWEYVEGIQVSGSGGGVVRGVGRALREAGYEHVEVVIDSMPATWTSDERARASARVTVTVGYPKRQA
jgi:hypothetical protein